MRTRWVRPGEYLRPGGRRRTGTFWAAALLVPVLMLVPVPAVATPLAGTPSVVAPALADGLALTPPMGWQSFKAFLKDIDEDLIKQQADLLVSSGLRDLGYDILIVDGGWRAPARDADGNMRAHPTKFPSGMKALGDYIHSKGLRFGLHQAVGMADCAGQDPGTQSAPGGEQQDANLFASWGVDVLKYDLCRYEFSDAAAPGAPDYDRIILRQDGVVVGRYEAESPANTVTGDSRVHACKRCSNGQSVTAIGFRNGSLAFSVNAPTAGTYTMQINYVNVDRSSARLKSALRQDRRALVSVNGQPPVVTHYPIPTRGTSPQVQVTDWDTVSTLSISVQLRAGANSIRFSAPNSFEDEVRAAYQRMADAVAATGRPMEIHLSEYGIARPWLWAHEAGHIWRIDDDLADAWDGVVQPPEYDGQGRRGIMYMLDRFNGLQRYAGPGGWNDPNTVEAGLGHMTAREYRTQFSLWAMAAAPLLLAMDLRTMTTETRNIVGNREVIAVSQDPLGVQGHKIRDGGKEEVWMKRMADDSRVVVLLNRNADNAVTMSVSAHNELGLPTASQYDVRRLWSHQTVVTGDSISVQVPPHGVAMMRIRPAA